MQEQVERLRRWKRGERPGPYTLEISPTLRCNLNCKFCWRRDPEAEIKADELSLKRYRELFKEAKKLNVAEVRVIGGGEPFFRQDIMQILRSIKANELYGYVCSNGTLLDEDRCRQLIDIGWDYVKFSLHGLETTHDRLVEKDGAFARAKQAIESLADSSIEVELGMVVVKDNYDQLDQMADWVDDIGVDYFFLEPITVYSELGRQLKPGESERRELNHTLRQLKEKNSLSFETNFASIVDRDLSARTNNMKQYILSQVGEGEGMAKVPCYEPFLKVGVRVDGRVAPCGFYDRERGDSIRNKTLQEAWYGDYFQERREEQLTKNLPDYCSKCCTTLVEKNRRLRQALAEG